MAFSPDLRMKQAGGKEMKLKSFEELTIQDDFMFEKVMQDMKNLKPLLERILPEIDFTGLKCIVPQKSMEEYYGKHGIRVDVFTEDDEHMFSVEMQVGKKEDLQRGPDTIGPSWIWMICSKGMITGN